MSKSNLEWLIELGREGKQPHAPLLDKAEAELANKNTIIEQLQNALFVRDTQLKRLQEAEEFHPRAAKLANKKKPFIVIAIDEPYFIEAYDLIRAHEMEKGTWDADDEHEYWFLVGMSNGWDGDS